MLKILSIFLLIPLIIQADLTNLYEILSVFNSNKSNTYAIGFVSQANADVIKGYLPENIEIKIYGDKEHLLQAVDNESVIAGVTTGHIAQDLEPTYHVFSSLFISPQAMILAPEYNINSTPYGLQNQSSNDLLDALNAAIADVQRKGKEETLLSKYNRTDTVRVYTCRQDSQLPVLNRNKTTGYMRDILSGSTKLKIGGIGPYDWGVHDGNYKLKEPDGFYPKLLDAIVEALGKLEDSDKNSYSAKISYERIFYSDASTLFQALLNGTIHATDVYTLIDAPYNGTGEQCTNDSVCRPRESCQDNRCTHPARPRSLHFRTTCTTASRDTKYITKKNSNRFKTDTTVATNKETPKTRWVAFLLLFTALFGTIFVTLLILVRRKKHYRIEHTLQGGFGKFARLQEEAEPPLDGMDAFDDHIVQSPTDNSNSTT